VCYVSREGIKVGGIRCRPVLDWMLRGRCIMELCEESKSAGLSTMLPTVKILCSVWESWLWLRKLQGASALMNNHAHVLLRTSEISLSGFVANRPALLLTAMNWIESLRRN
jgi:hypothetical protein